MRGPFSNPVLRRLVSLVVYVTAVALCGGCTAAMAGPAPETPYVVAVDDGFTQEERAELDACAAEWATFSGGRVLVEFTDGAAELTLRRSGPFPGGYVLRHREAWIDAEGLREAGFDARSGVRATCMNLVGQFFRIEMHDHTGVMGREDVVSTFTDEDLVVCRAAGMCD